MWHGKACEGERREGNGREVGLVVREGWTARVSEIGPLPFGGDTAAALTSVAIFTAVPCPVGVADSPPTASPLPAKMLKHAPTTMPE